MIQMFKPKFKEGQSNRPTEHKGVATGVWMGSSKKTTYERNILSKKTIKWLIDVGSLELSKRR